MPQIKKIVINLPKLLRHDSINSLMFGYVLGVTSALPSVTIKKAIELFMEDFNISEDDYSYDSARARFYEYYEQYREFRKDD